MTKHTQNHKKPIKKNGLLLFSDEIWSEIKRFL